MRAGDVVIVDWRDSLPDMREVNKLRPAIVVGAEWLFGDTLPFEMVVPLSGAPQLAIPGASIVIEPTPENGCTKRSFALAWQVQTVPHGRITPTGSRVDLETLRNIRSQLAACFDDP